MKKFIAIFVFTFLILVPGTAAFAQQASPAETNASESATPNKPPTTASFLDSYREEYRRYRTQYRKYELAREEYLKWRTLSARDGAISATRDFLIQCTNTLYSYFALLQHYCQKEQDLTSSARAPALTVVRKYLTFYNQFDSDVRKATTLTELEELGEELTEMYEQGREDSDYVKQLLSVAQLETLRKSSKVNADRVKGMVEEDPKYPGRARILENWFNKITKKLRDAADLHEGIWGSAGDFLDYDYKYKKSKLVNNITAESKTSQALVLGVLDHLLEIVRKKNY